MKISLLNSLKFRMPLVVFIGIVPVILLAIFYSSDRAVKTIKKEAQENISLRAKMFADAVFRWDEKNVLALHNLVQQPDIVSMNPEQQKPVLVKLVNTYRHLYLAMTTNRNGTNIARSDTSPLKNYQDRAWFSGAIAGENIVYETLISRTNKKPALCIATPIQKKELETLGVASICTYLEDLVNQVGQLKFGKTGYVFVVDKGGRLLAHPNSAYVSGEQLKDFGAYAPVKNILEGRNGSMSFVDEQGIKWISYSVNLKNGWGIVVLQQEAELLNSQKEFQELVLLVALITVLGVSVLIWVLANRLIQPMSDLTVAATAISDGQWHTKVEIDRKDELGALGKSFNQMATQLKTSFQDLEAKIEERTAELKQAKEAAEAANQTKDRFLANITHELRTPLNSILGYAKILQRDRGLQPRQVHSLRLIQQSGNHLLTLINDILDYYKNVAGKMELQLNELDLQTFLDEVVGIVCNWAAEKHLSFKCETKTNLPTGIKADEKRLRQVLINLLSNAIKFTEQGEVTLKVSAVELAKTSSGSRLPKQKLRFEIIDTGVGISPQQLDKIFQPFEQVGELKYRTGGIGLGLAISKQLVELMGSHLEVNSQLGKGSTFWFEVIFPVIEVVSDSQPDIADKILGYKGKKRKILVVDDKQENRLLLVNMLEPLGFDIVTVENGQQMLESLSFVQPDLILLDLIMPVKTGVGAIKELREKSEFKLTPVIVVSANYMTEEMCQYLECQAYLSKPIDEDKLLALLQSHLELEWIYREIPERNGLKIAKLH